MRDLPVVPGMEGIEANGSYWIEELGAWIAEDRYERVIIRDAVGAGAKIILGRDLK